MTTSLPRSQRRLRDLAALFRSPAPRRPRRRLALEALEDRVMLAANLTFNDFADVAGLDSAGNLYVYGEISRSGDNAVPVGAAADLDPGPGTKWLVGPTQYLAKYDPSGGLLWAKRADELFPAADAQILDVAISPNGQNFVYVAEGSASGSRSIARFQDTGTDLTPLWRTQTGGHGSIVLGGDGAVYMSNMFSGTLDFKPADPPDPTDTITSDGQDAFLAKWDVNGNFQWVRQLGGVRDEWMYDVAVVNDGVNETVCVAGVFSGTFAPQGYTGAPLTDQGSTTNSGDQDGYLVRYDTGGGFVSVGQFVDAYVRQVSGDASGTYIAGTHYYAALGLPGTRNDDIYFGKLDSSGQGLAWVKGLHGPASNTVGDLIVGDGSLLLTGNFWGGLGGAMDFDPGTGTYNLPPAGGGDAYVASYGVTNGAFQWARLMGSSTSGANEAGSSLVLSGTDLYVGGFFAPGQATFGSTTLTNTADFDGFVTRMSRTDGSHQWAFSVGSVVRTIDDGDAGYSESGSGWKNNTNGGFSGDSRYHMKGSGSNKAQWAFAGLPAGSYAVLVTWKADSKNASDARYKVNSTTVIKSQKVAPDDYLSDGFTTFWESLGTFVVGSDGALTVSLSDQANGNVVADAVRVVFTAPASSGSSPTAATNSSDFPTTSLSGQSLAPIVRASLTRWQPPIAATRIGETDVRIGELPGNQAAASSTSVEIGARSPFAGRKSQRLFFVH